jgi:hypothetical protein
MPGRWGDWIRERRDFFGWSQQELAGRLPGGVDATAISRWERGVVTPAHVNRKGLRQVLGEPPWEGGPPSTPSPACGKLTDVQRRQFLLHLAGVTGTAAAVGLSPAQMAQLLAGLVDESTDYAAGAVTNIGPATIPVLREQVREVAVAYVTQAPSACFAQMALLRDEVLELLKGRQRPAETADLHLLVGVLNVLLAGATVDFGDLRGAIMHALGALSAGERIGHHELMAWAFAMQSRAHRYGGRLRDAVAAAREGQRYADRGHVLARLFELEARARAEMGDRDAVRVVHQATDVARPAGLDISDLGGEFEISQAWLAYGRSGVHLALGDFDGVRRESELSLRLYEDHAPENQSGTNLNLARFNLAIALVHAGEIEGAREALAPVLALPVERHLTLYDGRLDDVAVQLAQPALSSPRTHQFADDIAAYRAARPALTA